VLILSLLNGVPLAGTVTMVVGQINERGEGYDWRLRKTSLMLPQMNVKDDAECDHRAKQANENINRAVHVQRFDNAHSASGQTAENCVVQR